MLYALAISQTYPSQVQLKKKALQHKMLAARLSCTLLQGRQCAVHALVRVSGTRWPSTQPHTSHVCAPPNPTNRYTPDSAFSRQTFDRLIDATARHSLVGPLFDDDSRCHVQDNGPSRSARGLWPTSNLAGPSPEKPLLVIELYNIRDFHVSSSHTFIGPGSQASSRPAQFLLHAHSRKIFGASTGPFTGLRRAQRSLHMHRAKLKVFEYKVKPKRLQLSRDSYILTQNQSKLRRKC